MATDDEQQPDDAATPPPSAATSPPPSDATSRPPSDGSAASAGAPGEPAPQRVRAYRTPRYSVFLVTGAVLGLAVGVAVALYGGSDEPAGSATRAGVLGYFAAFGTLGGALVAGTLAVVAESLLNRGRRGRARPAPRRPRGGTPPR